MILPSQSGLSSYDVGCVFFTHARDPLAEGIDYFERFARTGHPGDLAVHHTGIVGSDGQVIEAHWAKGVQRRPLADYLSSTDTLIVFRRPRYWTPELGKRIEQSAASQVGRPYNKGLILSQCASNTLLGHWLNRAFHGAPERWMAAKLDKKQAFICSQLSSWSLNEQPEFKGAVCGGAPLDTISPQELFEDEPTFAPF